jgi:hypothetical protein
VSILLRLLECLVHLLAICLVIGLLRGATLRLFKHL